MRTIKELDLCEYEGCNRLATGLAYSRNKGDIMDVCDECDTLVLDEGTPEYFHHCENCGCGLPIN